MVFWKVFYFALNFFNLTKSLEDAIVLIIVIKVLNINLLYYWNRDKRGLYISALSGL